MRRTKRIRKKMEVAALHVGLWTIPLLPRRAVLGLSRGLGSLAYHLARELRQVGEANLTLALGPDCPTGERDRILRESFRSFALTTLDLFWFTRKTRTRLARWVRLDDSSEIYLNDRPQICVTAHFGNWEILGQAVSTHGPSLLSVAAPLKNPGVDRVFYRMRQATGQTVIPKEGALRRLLKELRGHGKVGLLLDQNVRSHLGGVFVDFFGMPALVSEAGASLALRTGCEIIFGFCRPMADGSYLMYVGDHLPAREPVRRPAPEALHQLNQCIAEKVEQEIRKHPGNWLWTYKRWKYLPPDADRANFPYYAKQDPRVAT